MSVFNRNQPEIKNPMERQYLALTTYADYSKEMGKISTTRDVRRFEETTEKTDKVFSVKLVYGDLSDQHQVKLIFDELTVTGEYCRVLNNIVVFNQVFEVKVNVFGSITSIAETVTTILRHASSPETVIERLKKEIVSTGSTHTSPTPV